MKKQFKCILIVLCLTLVLSAIVLSACVDPNKPSNKITITVAVNLDGVAEKTFETDANAEFYSKLAQYVPQDVDGKVFAGWFDADGNEITSATRWSADGKVTARWSDVCAITFDKNNPQATGSMAVQTVAVGGKVNLNACGFTSSLVFDGWNTKPDGSGQSYADGAEVTLSANLTLYAQWKVTYTEEVYVERLVDGQYVYVKEKTTAVTNRHLGEKVSVSTDGFSEEHYFLDYDHPEALTEVTSLQNNDVLAAYYSIERFTVTYNDDQTKVFVRYNEQYSVRTPVEDPTSKTAVVSYSSSATGNGREYNFGDKLTLTSDIVLYPVLANVYTDAGDTGDKVYIRDISGKGSAILVVDGVRYSGFITKTNDLTTFDVVVNDVEVHGKLLSDGTFIYRNEDEIGTFLMGDSLFPEDVYPSVMLALDGYGIGVLSQMMTDGTGRIENYYVSYQPTDEGDYYMEYFLPADPQNVYKAYFQIFRGEIGGIEDLEIKDQIVGYFMFCGSEYGLAMRVYNNEILSNYALLLDGYGGAIYYEFDGNEIKREIIGYYYASENYTVDNPECVFEPDRKLNDSALIIDPFYFILFTQEIQGENHQFFIVKQNEAGVYRQTADVQYPQLELDGYGIAMYTASDREEPRYGYYTINTNIEGGYFVAVSFVDETGGTMRVTIDIENKLYQPFEGDFEIDADGALVKYYGSDSVITVPEGVTVIKKDAFKDVNITTITLPSTLQQIEDYAFENGSASGKSALKTVYLKAVNPPVLGQDVFRWTTSEFKVIVPNDSLQAYRQAESWLVEVPSLSSALKKTYAEYVTSVEEINNRPEFEVVDGVLISYNNKDENPQDVEIVIPDEVTAIAVGVFAGRTYIVSVDLNNVTEIGDSAFEGCTSLSNVIFNENTVSIGSYAFFYCTSLTQVDLCGVQTIGEYAFFRCYKLAKVNIGANIKEIGTFAFAMCSVEVDDGENVSEQHDLILTVTATTAPRMSSNIFINSVPRIYVESYDVGLSFASEPSWALYASHLRVKAEQTQIVYSLSNMGSQLVLGDNALFDETRYGLYKWDGNRLYIAWFDRSDFGGATDLNVIVQVGEYDPQTGYLRNFSLYDDTPLVFVTDGTQVDYANGDETLHLTFGSSQATYNGNPVAIEIVNYRMRFTYQGYIYHLTLTNDKTFTYKRDKVQEKVDYIALDGSEITVVFGNYIMVYGTLKNVDGAERSTETGWYATQESDGTYSWIIQWRENKYKIIATFNDADGTFTYNVEGYANSVSYRNDLDHVIVTTYSDGRVDILFGFKTANGDLSCNIGNAHTLQVQPNVYAVTINIMIDVVDDDGIVIGQVPSDYNGDYLLQLNPDDLTYTLTPQD